MTRKAHLNPVATKILLGSVDGTIYLDAVAPSNVIGAGHIEGGAKGIHISLRELRDAIDVAIARIHPTEDRKDLGYCMAGIQIVARNSETAPMLVLFDDDDRDAVRQCVVIAGAVPTDDPRTVHDAIAAEGEVE